MRLVDLSTLIEDTDRSPVDRTGITYRDHKEGARAIEALFSLPPSMLRNNEGWAVEEFNYFHTHSCTHVDAPYHYNSVIQGKPAQTIDELPLEWFYNDAVVLDMAHKARGDAMTPHDAERALEVMDYTLKPLNIVLVRTGCDEHYGKPDYMTYGCGVSQEATEWLFEQGIRVMGIDAWGWDAPLDMQAARAKEEDRDGVFWAAHQADLPYSQIERLVNLHLLPAHGFKIACFPLKIKAASAAPARVVAMVP